MKPDLKSIKIFTDTLTWAELLEFIINELNLKELGQQIETYVTGKTSYVLGVGFVFLKNYSGTNLDFCVFATLTHFVKYLSNQRSQSRQIW